MHAFDTRLHRNLAEMRITEAQRIAEQDWARARGPHAWDGAREWARDHIKIQPPRLHIGGRHRPLTH